MDLLYQCTHCRGIPPPHTLLPQSSLPYTFPTECQNPEYRLHWRGFVRGQYDFFLDRNHMGGRNPSMALRPNPLPDPPSHHWDDDICLPRDIPS